MAEAYATYATAQLLHAQAHNAYRVALRRAGYKGRRLDPTALAGHLAQPLKDAGVVKALKQASETAIYLGAAKAQYAQARAAAETAGRAA